MYLENPLISAKEQSLRTLKAITSRNNSIRLQQLLGMLQLNGANLYTFPVIMKLTLVIYLRLEFNTIGPSLNYDVIIDENYPAPKS